MLKRNAIFLFAVFCLSCGKKQTSAQPNVISDELQSEIARISKLVYWCDGEASGPRKNNMDGRPNCDVGDAPSESGWIALVSGWNKENIFTALTNSFGPNNQPFRAPSYVGKDYENEFSRDQLLGFFLATKAGLPRKLGTNRIEKYVEDTGKLCPHPTDNRCIITPGMKILWKRINDSNPTVVEKLAEAAEIKVESETVPLNYQAMLTANHIFLMGKMNKLTTTFANAAKKLASRAPNNLWFQTVSVYANNGSKKQFESIANKLVGCMKQWQKPGTDWALSEGNTNCPTNVYGHEWVALGSFLLSAKAISAIEDDTNEVDNFIKEHQNSTSE